MKRPRVLLADENSLILAGIQALLASSCDIVALTMDGRSAIDAALELRPDLIIMDVSMPLLNGIDAAWKIKKAWPEAKILFLGTHANLHLREALGAGGAGYVLKSSSAAKELPVAVQTVLNGDTYIDPAFGRNLLERLRGRPYPPLRSSIQLTDRQREVLQLVAEGRSNKEVAAILNISVKTVEFHRGRIMRKVGARSTAELTKLAVQLGISRIA